MQRGRPHPLEELRQRLRSELLAAGFDEEIPRSHDSESWLETVGAVRGRRPLPLRLFSSGSPAFVSLVSETASLDEAKELASRLLAALGLRAEFRGDVAFAGDAKVAEVSLNVPKTLADQFAKEAAIAIDLASAAAALAGTDANAAVFPQFYTPISLTDRQIADLVKIRMQPRTEIGRAIARAIVRTAELQGAKPSPCRFMAYEWAVKNGKMEVWLIKPEAGKKLCGRNALDEIYVSNGNVLCGDAGAASRGLRTGIRLIDAFAALAATQVEGMAGGYDVIRVDSVGSQKDINLSFPEVVENFAQAQKKQLLIRGDFSTAVEAKFI